MDNSKRNIHNSGPLGMLVKSGQVKKIDDSENEVITIPHVDTPIKTGGSYFRTQTGIEFAEQELIYVDPQSCEPWKYANRHQNEMGEIEVLVESIKVNKQLQPALVRKHPNPHDGIEYEVIFGRRRHIACLELGIPFLVIKKEIPTIEEAIVAQDAENKHRNNIGHYSNARLYSRLLNDGVFKTERELAEKLRISTTSMNALMAFTKIPDDITRLIPDIHTLSKSFALKLVAISKQSKKHHALLIDLASQIGKSITSPSRLEKLVNAALTKKPPTHNSNTQYLSEAGKKLFTFKYDQRGTPCIAINKALVEILDVEALCTEFREILDAQLQKSRYRDF